MQPPLEVDPSMFVGQALDEAFVLQRIEAVHGGLVRRDLAAGLDLPDERRALMASDVVLEIPQHHFLFFGELRQERLEVL